MRRKTIIISLLLLISITIVTLANRRGIITIFKTEKAKAQLVKNPISKPKLYDSVLLLKLDEVLKCFNMGRTACTIAGTINTENKADTSEKIKNVSFLFCKRGDNFYYKMDKKEVINENGICLNINHDTKKVFMTAKKQLDIFKMIDINKLKEVLQTEEYDLLKQDNGKLETISLLNEHHITCKEYAVTFDTISKKLVGIRYRLTYFREPLKKSKEKIITIKLSQSDSTANIDLYNNKNKVISQLGKLTAKYSGYELIHL